MSYDFGIYFGGYSMEVAYCKVIISNLKYNLEENMV